MCKYHIYTTKFVPRKKNPIPKIKFVLVKSIRFFNNGFFFLFREIKRQIKYTKSQ